MKQNLFIVLFFLVLGGTSALGQHDSTAIKKKKLSFRDPVDGAFDVSSFLLEHNGVLPVIIPITEPAVGYGGALALLYFHKRKKNYNSYVPNNVTGIIGLTTENKTWGAGAFHSHTFGENKIRTLTAVFKPDVNIDYYGNDSNYLAENPVGINLKSWGFHQKAQVRIGNTNLYVGGAYTYFNSEVSFDTMSNSPILSSILSRLNTNSTIGAITPLITYDNRNNTFTPTTGLMAEAGLTYSADWLGSDDNYSTLKTSFFGYWEMTNKLRSKYRFDGSYLFGDAPFYVFPFVDLRGIPAMRYQSDITIVAETEWSYNVFNRWWVTAFSGAGNAFTDFSDLGSVDWVYNIGTGFRYRLARQLGIDMGTDFAWGNGKDFAFYIVFGKSW